MEAFKQNHTKGIMCKMNKIRTALLEAEAGSCLYPTSFSPHRLKPPLLRDAGCRLPAGLRLRTSTGKGSIHRSITTAFSNFVTPCLRSKKFNPSPLQVESQTSNHFQSYLTGLSFLGIMSWDTQIRKAFCRA